jgi:surface antigen
MPRNRTYNRMRAASTRTQRQFFARRALLLKIWVGMAIGFGFNYSVFNNLTINAAGEPQYVAGSSSIPVANAATPSVIVGSPVVHALPVDSTIQQASAQPAPTGSFRNRYAYGNCTYYVAGRRNVPSNWGNARTWYPRAAAAGWRVGATPAIGAIAWTPNGWYGHVALVEGINGNQVLVSEMNYNGWNRVDRRWAPASSFKYIY